VHAFFYVIRALKIFADENLDDTHSYSSMQLCDTGAIAIYTCSICCDMVVSVACQMLLDSVRLLNGFRSLRFMGFSLLEVSK